ncbi:MAG TPA: bifunctional adenosylcobinamide kinase/adenosylcobinamide-phosphate guanylyltransferase [Nitrospiria bacterium]|nr:bifunctional adenosylcobinamide kinase/adenosylcobinamide-phosphate guanylyltransferase [Nitrospiria bacterium]
MRRRVIFLLGGARSGKSDLALEMLAKGKGKRGYIATAEALDDEMTARIHEHRRRRGPIWETFEVPIDLPDVLKKLAPTHSFLLVDCLTLWLSNLVTRHNTNKPVLDRFEALVEAMKEIKRKLVLVSNEVGMGIVPDHPLGRRYRDLSGLLHQKVAAASDEVYWVAAGIPLKLK